MKTKSIASVMTKNVVSVTPNQDILDIKHIYEKEEFHRHIPVIENDKLVGMVSLVDFMYNILGAGLNDDNPVYKNVKVKDIMTANPFYLNSDVTLEDVAKVLADGKFHAVPILENQKLVGIVSTADIIQHLLEEV